MSRSPEPQVTAPPYDPPRRPWRLGCGGFDLADDPGLIDETIALALANDAYERAEIAVLRALLKPGDRLLEIGGGFGVVALHAARILGPDNVVSYEANPQTADAAARNFRLNAMPVRLIQAAVTAQGGDSVQYRANENFLAGSLHENVEAGRGMIEVQTVSLADALTDSRANVILMDIEGGEAALAASDALGPAEAVVAEIHPQILGAEGAIKAAEDFAAAGLHPRADLIHGDVYAFTRLANHDDAARDAVAASLRAAAAHKTGDYASAAEQMRAFIDLAPGNPDAHERLTQIHLAAGDPESAAAEAETFHRLDPANPVSSYLAGVCEMRRGHPAAAVKYAEAAIALAPAAPRYRHMSCQAAHQAGMTGEALRHAVRLAELAPYAANHIALLQRAYRQAGLKELAAHAAGWAGALTSRASAKG